MHSVPVGPCWPPLTAPHTHHHLLPQRSGHITWNRWKVALLFPAPRGRAGRGATSRQTASASVLGTMESREPRGEPPHACSPPSGDPPALGQGEREPINRGKFAGTGSSPIRWAGQGREGRTGCKWWEPQRWGRGRLEGSAGPGGSRRLCKGLAKAPGQAG